MAWITTTELSAFRDVLTNVLPDTCVISSPGYVADGAGGGTVTYTPVSGGTVACRVDPMLRRGQEETVGGAEGLVFDYVVTVPYDAPIAIDRRITHNALVYEIRQMADDQSWRICRRAYVARVE